MGALNPIFSKYFLNTGTAGNLENKLNLAIPLGWAHLRQCVNTPPWRQRNAVYGERIESNDSIRHRGGD